VFAGSTTAGTGFTFGSDTGTTFGSGATFGTGATWGFGRERECIDVCGVVGKGGVQGGL